MISPLAYVDPSAQIGENVEIGPFCFIDKNVVIGDNNIIMPHVNIMYGSRIGNGNQIHPGAVITISLDWNNLSLLGLSSKKAKEMTSVGRSI